MTASRTRDLRLCVDINAKADEIYRALTSATRLCRWWLEGAETDARNTGRFRMVWPKLKASDSRLPFPPHVACGESEGVFVDLDPGRKVAWLWKAARKKDIPLLASFFIRPKRRGCEVTLVHAGFPKNRASDKRYAGCASGWEDCLAKLKLYLESGKSCRSQVLTLDDVPRLKKASK